MAYDAERFHKTKEDTAPSKLKDMDVATLEACHHFLTEQSMQLTIEMSPFVQHRMELLRREIELRHLACQHEASMRREGWTLFWAIVAGVGTIALVLLETPAR